jgi:UPF0716 protein FxsA
MAFIVLALIVVPVVEIYVLLQVGHLIGVLPTIALLIAVSALGAWLIRREGARTWSAFTAALGGGRLPAREVADGALVMFGGALLLTPGFVTDLVGLLCILPPSRAVLRRVLMSYVARRATSASRVGGRSAPTVHVRAERQDGARSVIDGELHSNGEPPRT